MLVVRMLMSSVLLVLLLLGGLAGAALADEGPWEWPLTGPHQVGRPFAPPASTYGAGHRGADLPSAEGAPVRAAAAGRITYAGLLAGRGVVVVTHGALRTTYEPVVASVQVGQSVALGEVLGRLSAGHAGCPVAACLHWGLRRGEQYLDPVRLVERGPVRLLPLDGAGLGPRGALRGGGDEQPAAPLINADLAHLEPPPEVREDRVDHQVAPPAPLPPAVAEPSWSVRAAEAPLGVAAVAALVLGVGLLARPRPRPPGPASGGLAAATTPPAEDDGAAEPGLLLDLDSARARREAAS